MDEFRLLVADQIARRIRLRRKGIGMSQEALAQRASLSRGVVALIEAGGRNPRSDTLLRIAGGLVVPPAYLVAGLEWEVGEVWLPARDLPMRGLERE